MFSLNRFVIFVILAAALYLAPLGFGASGSIYAAFVLIAIFAVMAYGLDLIVSDLGEVSLAHTVFFASGAYATALLSTTYSFNSWMTLLCSIVVAVALALFIALITLRLREFVFSLVTYALTVVAMTIAANWGFLGGSDGIRGIPSLDLSLFGLSLKAANDRELWPYAFIVLSLTVYLIHRFRASRLGAAAVMVHLNPRLAMMSGIDPATVRLQVFVFSAAVSSVAGWLYAYQRAYVSADLLDNYFLLLMLTAVVFVGKRQLLGPLGATALILTQEKFFSFGGYNDKIVLGGVLVLTLALFPRGLMSVPSVLGLRTRRAHQ